MAIQLPDPGTGVPADKTGDSPWLAMKKVRENFSDQTNAASKLVGTGAGHISLNKDISKRFAEMSITGIPSVENLDKPEFGMRRWNLDHAEGTPLDPDWGPYAYIQTLNASGSEGFSVQLALPYGTSVRKMHGLAVRSESSGSWNPWYVMWHNKNATKDSNGFLKASSPIVKVFADKVELNDDAVSQNVTYKKNGIGDYTITTQSGLSTDGWYIELPKDMNGNPKVAVTLQETNGVISLKTYKRIFSMETFTFEPDLDSPLDIPDTRWIDLRLNEIPVEPSEPELEV